MKEPSINDRVIDSAEKSAAVCVLIVTLPLIFMCCFIGSIIEIFSGKPQ